MSKSNKKLDKPIEFMRKHFENGINLTADAVREYLEAYNIARASKRQFYKTIIAIVLSNLGTLIATALGLG
jgi:hypothetical protein